MRFQVWHAVVLILVILVVFGSARLPQIAQSLGQSLKIFKREVQELRDEEGSPAARSADLPPTTPEARDTRPDGPGLDPNDPRRSA
ncbi:MAG TPA: twin-arginine translocase TatA/TatE family subunit [Actinomycetaceae bacterium]|nr:twin-arginine translocase TatA/TatE family subunit [Actinomycetaceae bacterium]